VYSGEDHEGGAALLEEGTGGDELEGKCEEIYDEESTELDTADGGFPVVTAIDEPKGDDDAESASDDIGDVANGVFRACSWDTTLWIDAYGRGCCVERCTEEGGRGIMLKLAIKKVAPRIRGNVCA
jgi:hypothetical protein